MSEWRSKVFSFCQNLVLSVLRVLTDLCFIIYQFYKDLTRKDCIMGNRSTKTVIEEVKMVKNEIESISVALQDGVNAESTLYRIKRGSVLRVKPGASLLGQEIILFTNYPEEGNPFVRTSYRVIDWCCKDDIDITSDIDHYVHVYDTDIYSQVKINLSGTFHFYFKHKENKESSSNGSIYVQVEPSIEVGPTGAKKTLSLDSIRCQTVLSKCLGPLSTWEAKLRVTKESGYNMIHFTPIQMLGESRSAYSLKNQLKLNLDFSGEKAATFECVEAIVKKCREEWGIASICDIVLNHTANDSDWILEYPEATYSCQTCPHLRPAFLLDICLEQCALDIVTSALENVGVPEIIDNEHHLNALRHQLHTQYLTKINLHELYQCHIQNTLDQFINEMRKRPPPKKTAMPARHQEIKIQQDPNYGRLASTINLDLALDIFNVFHSSCFDEDSRLKKCAQNFREHLESLNGAIHTEIQGHLCCAVDNCIAGIRYERVANDGPKLRVITKKHPVFMNYFTHTGMEKKSLLEIEKAMYGEEGRLLMAHNGWVMGSSDPLSDFAKPQPGRGNVYLRRELISWGDSVKLRFGDKPEDSPRLWNHMKEYVGLTAKIFDGVRLDNCHSTPLHVAEYLLDHARSINPELFVAAELFTNSDGTDNIFVNRLGITSLIREAQSAWDSHEEGRLVYRYGGAPVGAFNVSSNRLLSGTIAHALFLDLTHDNPSPVEKRSVFDLLPTAALVSMACCATGSNRGYDEIVPHHIHVVDEERQYQEWGKGVNFDCGIVAAKRALNLLHGELAEEGFSQVFVDQMDPNIVAVTRHSPTTHQSVILIAHTSFGYPNADAGGTPVRPLRFEGSLDEIILEAELKTKHGSPFERPKLFKKDPNYINGITDYNLSLREHISLNDSRIFSPMPIVTGNVTQLNIVNLRPGSVVAVRVSLHQAIQTSFTKLQEITNSLIKKNGDWYAKLEKAVNKLDLVNLNRALFTCDEEERDRGHGGATYDIPGHGTLVYCGLQGFVSLLADISPNNDLGHPLCNNLRLGDWMMEYIANRLMHDENTKELSSWFSEVFNPLKQIPRYLIPRYFDIIVSISHASLVKHAFSLMSNFIKDGSNFPRSLGLASLQFLARCNSANLPKLSSTINPPAAPERCVTLSAGLPHFSTGYMRCWGRDTFIALRGTMFLVGRYNEARYIILGFGQCMRHGLIPNLLDNGVKPRFNCRDAVWWWLHSIKQYVEEAPNGKDILHDKVSRIFPKDDSVPLKAGECVQLLHDVMQEALNIHFQGLVFRERNAGTEIDAHMKDKGFNVQIGINPETGFVFGGNDANCGTWMDKMGSSEKAGNRGKPTTPRDGSAVELVGLQMAVLQFMNEMHEKAIISHNSVERIGSNGQTTTWTYKQWANRIKENFEKEFYIGDIDAPLVNKKHIYKDSVGSSENYTDYQLRCNFPIAMVVAPELFDPKHAWAALETAGKYLLGPLGMKTLDPDDWAYHGNYENSDDSDNPATAHGANYHQGPEWVWPIGFYLRARLIFARKVGTIKETVEETWDILKAHLNELQSSHWRGLPELTNEKGAYCKDSCRTQAWSIATVLEVLHDLQIYRYEHK